MRKQADGKVRRSPEEWARIFERFHESKMTAADFCRREKLAKGSFEKWKKKVGRRSKVRAASPAFVEWPSPTQSVSNSSMTPPALCSGELELTLPGGVVIRWKS